MALQQNAVYASDCDAILFHMQRIGLKKGYCLSFDFFSLFFFSIVFPSIRTRLCIRLRHKSTKVKERYAKGHVDRTQ